MGIVFAGAGSHAPGIRAWADAAEKRSSSLRFNVRFSAVKPYRYYK